jgi:membrane protein required for colicin V production
MRNTDIIIIVPLIWGTYRGIYRGLISEITSLVATIVVFYFSIKYYAVLATYINEHIHSKLPRTYISVAAFVLLFLLMYIVLYAISNKIEKLTQTLHISFLNHAAGGLFGLLKWAFMLSMIISLMDTFGPKFFFTIDFHHTWLYDHIRMIAPTLMPGVLKKYT